MPFVKTTITKINPKFAIQDYLHSRPSPFLLLGRGPLVASSSSPRPIFSNQSSIEAPYAEGGFLSFFAFVRFTPPLLLPLWDGEGFLKSNGSSGHLEAVTSPLFLTLAWGGEGVDKWMTVHISPQLFYAPALISNAHIPYQIMSRDLQNEISLATDPLPLMSIPLYKLIIAKRCGSIVSGSCWLHSNYL